MFLAPEIIFGCAPPKFWTALIKLGLVLTIVQNFKPVSPRISEISCSEKKLEIWGKAQRESAQRPKSDWGKLEGGGKFPWHQSHVARTQMHCYTPNAHCRLRVGQHECL